MSGEPDIFQSRILNHLTVIRSSFAFGLQYWAVLRDPKTSGVIEWHQIIVKSDGIYALPPESRLNVPEGELFYKLELAGPGGANLEHAAMEFVKMLLRIFTVDTFEKLRRHCKETGESGLMQRQPWYQFARMVRNSLNHSQTWDFNSYDLSLLPVTWNNKTIEASMKGNEMTWEFYDCFDALELWDEVYAFARTLPSVQQGLQR